MFVGIYCCLVCIYSGISGDRFGEDKSTEFIVDSPQNEWSFRGAQRLAEDQALLQDDSCKTYGTTDEASEPFYISIHSWYSRDFSSFIWNKISFFALCCLLAIIKCCIQFPILLGIPYNTPAQILTLHNTYLFLTISINCCTLYWIYWLFTVLMTLELL